VPGTVSIVVVPIRKSLRDHAALYPLNLARLLWQSM